MIKLILCLGLLELACAGSQSSTTLMNNLRIQRIEKRQEKMEESQRALQTTTQDIANKTENILLILNEVKQGIINGNTSNDIVLNNTVQILEIISSSFQLESKFEDQVKECFLNTTDKSNTGSYVNTTNTQVKSEVLGTSCRDLLTKGVVHNGIYTIYPFHEDKPIEVYYDQETDGGGWIVFQRRQDGSVDFDRNWTEYEDGVGELDGEFWLGNELVSLLTATGRHALRIELDNIENRNTSFAKYKGFSIGSKQGGYVLNVKGYSGFSGDTKDSMIYHNGMKFFTKDMRHSEPSPQGYFCAKKYQGGWWFKYCFDSHLNGLYDKGGLNQCICWARGLDDYCPVCHKYVEMKFR